jgi:hypothetical protein
VDAARTRSIQKRRVKNLRGGVGGADFARDLARFFFERAESEVGAICAIAKILTNPLFKPTAAFALRDVHEIVQN